MSLFWKTVFITSIIIFGMWIRLHNLDTVPLGFFCDEASIAYNAFTLLSDGKDEYGVSFPLFFQSFGDWRPPLAVYATIPFIAQFGLHEIAPRLMAAFFGILALYLLYALGKELYSTRVGLWASFIAATMPWMIHYSRVGFEFSIYCTFFIAMVLFFVKATKKKHWIIPAWIVAALTLYTYQPARLMVPLMIIGIIVIYRKQFLKYTQHTMIGCLLFILLCTPLALTFVTGEATARFQMISVFSENLPPYALIDRMLHNYLLQVISVPVFGEVTQNLRHFSFGLDPLLPITAPFYVIGGVVVFKTLKKQKAQLLLLWLLIYPLAAAVVAEPPFTSRAIIGAPLIAILIALGITRTIAWSKRYLYKPILVTGIIILILINFQGFYTFYQTSYARVSWGYWGWQYGPKEIIHYYSQNRDNYDELIMTNSFNGGHIFFRFYAPYTCQSCQISSPGEAYDPLKKQLFSIPPDEMDPLFLYHPVKTIYYPDGTEAFILTEIRGRK